MGGLAVPGAVDGQLLAELLAPLAAAPAAVLFLDYDGTLAPFREQRYRAVPYPGVKPALLRISSQGRTRLVMVSGRPAAEVEALLDLGVPLEIWGGHGHERWHSGGQIHIPTLSPDVQRILEEAELRCAGITSSDRIERKRASVAVHARGLPQIDQQRLEGAAERALGHLITDPAVEWTAFNGGWELRAAHMTKARAVSTVLNESPPGTFAAYLGDDATDEDAFCALAGSGVSFLTTQEPRPSHARFWLRPPDGVLQLLASWDALRKG